MPYSSMLHTNILLYVAYVELLINVAFRIPVTPMPRINSGPAAGGDEGGEFRDKTSLEPRVTTTLCVGRYTLSVAVTNAPRRGRYLCLVAEPNRVRVTLCATIG